MALLKTHFPKQIIVRFLTTQIFVVIPILVFVTLLLNHYVKSTLTNTTDIHNAIAQFDKAFLLILGLMILTMVGISFWTGFRLVLPLGRILLKAEAIMRKDYARTDTDDSPNASTTETGEWSDLERTLNRIRKNMQKQDLSLTRERSEFEAILSAIAEAVVAVDKNGALLFFNPQFTHLFGDPNSYPGDVRLSDFFRDPESLEAFQKTLLDGSASTANLQLNKNSSVYPSYYSLSVAPLRLEKSEIYGAVGIFHDVTELKKLDQIRIDFVANVSHELRTPLTSIKGYSSALFEDLKDEGLRSYLQIIQKNTDRLIALVQDLLHISSLESGETILEREEIDLKSLSERVIGHLAKQSEDKQQNIYLEIKQKSLIADPLRVEQVLSNLIENAIKYIQESGKIWVTWEQRGNDIALIVRDNGPGIPLEHQPRIFERFYRADKARSREKGGTGLGLSIVKHVLQRHGGTVSVRGGPDSGSEFVCLFPIINDHNA